MIVDNDLLSIQNARILAEEAEEAQRKLAQFPQEKLDQIVATMAQAVETHLEELALFSQEETGIGRWQDKLLKNRYVCSWSRAHLQGMQCVGVLHEDRERRVTEIGVPVGVVVATCSATSPVSTMIYNALIAIKSGNALIFVPHQRAEKTLAKTFAILKEAAEEAGLPEGCLGSLSVLATSGVAELINHPLTTLLLVTGDEEVLQQARCSGKPIIYGGTGNGPVFIERTADIKQAALDIVASKSFDHGIASSAEQALVVDAPVAEQVREALSKSGAYFMDEAEANALVELFFSADGKVKRGVVGVSAHELADRAGFSVPANTLLLVAERHYVSERDPFYREFLAPVLAMYVEEDWMFACEKCIELLVQEKRAHSLVIHSQDDEVINQFAMKKPVARLLVNTPGAFGGIGATTNLFPSLLLGSSSAGHGITSDNVSPLNLTYRRKVGYGVRSLEQLKQEIVGGCSSRPLGRIYNEHSEPLALELVQEIMHKVLDATKGNS